jgi:hypothetical protein
MSTLITDELSGRKDGNHIIALPNNNTLYAPGHVIQTVWRKMDQHATYNSFADNVSRDISGLDISITLKRANSQVYLQWYLFYESHYDLTFQAKRGGTVIGFNSEVGNVRWSGIGVGEYEHSFNQDSTPSYTNLCWFDSPGSVGPHTYTLGSRSSTGTNYDIRINRSWGSFSDNYEAGVSWAIVQEIAV